MTNARRPGADWTGFAGRNRSRAKALLVALPLLLLSLLVGHGVGAPPADARNHLVSSAGEASDMTRAEGRAGLAQRAALLAADPLRAKSKLAADGEQSHALAPSVALAVPGTVPASAPGAATRAQIALWPVAPHPRAPPPAG